MCVDNVPAQRKKTAKISVIIPNYNGHALLQQCLQALSLQTFRQFEIIVVDNGSTDNSRELLTLWQPLAGVTMQVVILAENQGFATAINQGIKVATGKYIAFLNNDTVPKNNWLKVLNQRLDDRLEISFCACKLILHSNPGIIDVAGHSFSKAGTGIPRLRWQLDDLEANRETEVFGACGAAAMYRREVLFEVGLLDEDFFCYYEDIDLDARLRLAGYRCLYVPEAVVRHQLSATAGGWRSDFIVYHSSRNQEWLYLKVMPGMLFWSCLPAHFIYNLLRFAVYALRGQAGVYLRGKIAAFSGFANYLEKRKKVQKQRKITADDFASLFDKHWFKQNFWSKFSKNYRKNGIETK